LFENAIELARYIDHTLLGPTATFADIVRLCDEARAYSFNSVCVSPCYVPRAVERLGDSGIGVCAVIGFPHGSTTTAVKVMEGVEAVRNGASELDVVMNIGYFKSAEYEKAALDIRDFVVLTPGVVHKVIIETCYLTDAEKAGAARLVAEMGGDFVKTSTGFGTSGARVEDIAIIRHGTGGKCKIKASGGIRDLDTFARMVEAGADRIGTSSGVAIVQEYIKRLEGKGGTA
jgi:deoxyribose-phosphate aldolase